MQINANSIGAKEAGLFELSRAQPVLYALSCDFSLKNIEQHSVRGGARGHIHIEFKRNPILFFFFY